MRLNKAWKLFGFWELAVSFRCSCFFSITLEKSVPCGYDVWDVERKYRVAF